MRTNICSHSPSIKMDKPRRARKNSEDGGPIEKTKILQEAKQSFMATSVKTEKLVDVLGKCIFIILQGERLTNTEATDLFFHITRLFQYKNKDNTLRRLTYIGTKALSQQADNVYVVTSSLTTDVNSSRDAPAVRASALRALCQISEPSTFTSIERYLRQSVVDRHPVVASAALTSLIRIARTNREIVRKCADEIQEALNSDSPMVQYHALALSYIFYKDEPAATVELLTKSIELDLKSPLAICLLLKLMSNHIHQTPINEQIRVFMSYIRDCMDHSSDMVKYEAANVVAGLKEGPKTVAVGHLRNFLSSPNASLRYAASQALNKLAATSTADIRFWSVHKIGKLCKLHLLNKRYRPGEEIIGILDFHDSDVLCAKYDCILQCEEMDCFEIRNEFSIGTRQCNFVIRIPQLSSTIEHQAGSFMNAILSFLFYVADRNHPRALFEDRAGTIELGPSELETKQFSCDFPIAIYT